MIFFYQQWINKIKGILQGYPNPYTVIRSGLPIPFTKETLLYGWIITTLKWENHTQKITNRLPHSITPRTEATYIHLATQRVIQARCIISATTDYTDMWNSTFSTGDLVDQLRRAPTNIMIINTHYSKQLFNLFVMDDVSILLLPFFFFFFLCWFIIVSFLLLLVFFYR